jgi:hypothetical protein
MWTALRGVDREPLGSVASLMLEREDGGLKVRTAGLAVAGGENMAPREHLPEACR